mmetsp:Transcript_27972/g.66270  ORF Transcript_27972/g.66270 Transcript_27972/m.66270 type:complete len:133 (+) Transcript_27972:639-1037(+)
MHGYSSSFVSVNLAQVKAAYAEATPEFKLIIPQLPPKENKLFKKHSSAGFIERRRKLLDTYLKALIQVPDLNAYDDLMAWFQSKDLYVTESVEERQLAAAKSPKNPIAKLKQWKEQRQGSVEGAQGIAEKTL